MWHTGSYALEPEEDDELWGMSSKGSGDTPAKGGHVSNHKGHIEMHLPDAAPCRAEEEYPLATNNICQPTA